VPSPLEVWQIFFHFQLITAQDGYWYIFVKLGHLKQTNSRQNILFRHTILVSASVGFRRWAALVKWGVEGGYKQGYFLKAFFLSVIFFCNYSWLASTQLNHWTKWLVTKDPNHHVGPKKLSRTVSNLVSDWPAGGNSSSRCLWAGESQNRPRTRIVKPMRQPNLLFHNSCTIFVVVFSNIRAHFLTCPKIADIRKK